MTAILRLCGRLRRPWLDGRLRRPWWAGRHCRPWRVAWVVLLLAVAAGAADREFAGMVESVTPAHLTVTNRMGDRRAFVGGAKTPVVGARTSWAEIQPGDPVIVHWALADDPVRAVKVRVRRRKR